MSTCHSPSSAHSEARVRSTADSAALAEPYPSAEEDHPEVPGIPEEKTEG